VRARRAEENRGRFVEAAIGLFLRDGWTPTTMSRVAATAGLSRPALYLHFDTKLSLLLACIDASLSDVPVRDRPDFQAMGTGTVRRRTEVAARWLRKAYERAAAIQRVLDDAAAAAPEAERARQRMEQRRHDEFAHACALVLGLPLAPDDPLVDEVWALGSRAMWFTFAERGWSADRWEAWFARVLREAVRAHRGRGRPG